MPLFSNIKINAAPPSIKGAHALDVRFYFYPPQPPPPAVIGKMLYIYFFGLKILLLRNLAKSQTKPYTGKLKKCFFLIFQGLLERAKN
jgi:hypothetical protein